MTKPKWEERFAKWMDNNSDFMGGISSNIIPDLKSFIHEELSNQVREILDLQEIIELDGIKSSFIDKIALEAYAKEKGLDVL